MTKGSRKMHWDRVYESRDEEALSWFEAEPALSLRLIGQYAGPEAKVIDVGAGASRLPDALLARGYDRLALLDVSAPALAMARARLGDLADRVRWIEADVTRWRPGETWDLWHDRAVFHFLTGSDDRRSYLEAMSAALTGGGHAILATFDEHGPETCSGLPVMRYSPPALIKEIEARMPGMLTPVAAERHVHVTPKGNEQSFQYSVFRRE